MNSCHHILFAAAFAGLVSTVSGQTVSGPNVGSTVKGFKVAATTGEQAGKEIDFVAERKGRPTVYLFVQAENFSRPQGRFMHNLDDELAKDRKSVV